MNFTVDHHVAKKMRLLDEVWAESPDGEKREAAGRVWAIDRANGRIEIAQHTVALDAEGKWRDVSPADWEIGDRLIIPKYAPGGA